MKPLSPEKTRIEFLSDGERFIAHYSATSPAGEYIYEIFGKVSGCWMEAGIITGSELFNKLESGEFDEIKEVEVKNEFN